MAYLFGFSFKSMNCININGKTALIAQRIRFLWRAWLQAQRTPQTQTQETQTTETKISELSLRVETPEQEMLKPVPQT